VVFLAAAMPGCLPARLSAVVAVSCLGQIRMLKQTPNAAQLVGAGLLANAVCQ
jgi:hypothetical protein